MKISNRLIVCGLIWGLVLKIWGNGYMGILYFILNITIPVVLFILLFQMHALLTTRQLFQVIVYAFLFAAVLGMGKVLYVYFSQGGKKDRFTKIHFSIEILLAVVYVTGRCVVAKN